MDWCNFSFFFLFSFLARSVCVCVCMLASSEFISLNDWYFSWSDEVSQFFFHHFFFSIIVGLVAVVVPMFMLNIELIMHLIERIIESYRISGILYCWKIEDCLRTKKVFLFFAFSFHVSSCLIPCRILELIGFELFPNKQWNWIDEKERNENENRKKNE